MSLEGTDVACLDSFGDAFNHVDFANDSWSSAELGDEKEILTVVEFSKVDEGGVLLLEMTLRSELKIGLSGGESGKSGAQKNLCEHT